MDSELIRIWEQLVVYFVVIFQHSYTEILENCGKPQPEKSFLWTGFE
jgi:hypothetical protein